MAGFLPLQSTGTHALLLAKGSLGLPVKDSGVLVCSEWMPPLVSVKGH